MLPYFVLFAFFAVGAIASGLRPVRLNRPWLFSAAILLIVLVGFRWRIGTDWAVYELLLNYSRLGGPASFRLSTEPLYALVNLVAADLGWGLWFPNLVCAGIFTYGLLLFCRDQPNPWLALVVATPYLILGVAMGYTRQSAAVGLVMTALVQLKRGHTVRVFILLLLAAMFHISAIIVAPVFALAVTRRAVVTGILLALFGVALYVAFSQRIAMRMSEYATYQYVAAGAIPRLSMNAVAAAIFLLARRRFSSDRSELRLWTIFSLMAFLALLMLFSMSSTTILDRFGIFIVPLQMFVLSRVPLVFSRGGRSNMVLILALIFYCLAAEIVWLKYGREARSYWVPYRNYLWEKWSEGRTPR